MENTSPSVSAAIDIGSNSFRILIGTFDSQVTIFKKELLTVRLAEGLNRSGKICDEAMYRAINALQLFHSLIIKFNVQQIRVCGTEAVRRAQNSDVLRFHCQQILNTPMYILDGGEEASLTLAGVFADIASQEVTPRTKNSLVIDVGGGSTECIFSSVPHFPAQSLPLGALSITEKFFHNGIASPRQINKATLHIKEMYTPVTEKFANFVSSIIGSGGTATSLASLNLELQKYDSNLIHGSRISQPELNSLVNRLTFLPLSERSLLPGLDEGRGEIILGGALIYQVVMDLLAADQIFITDSGLLEGIFLSLF